MRVACLGSGSRGNALLVEGNGTRLLVDAGFSAAEIGRRLERLEVEPESVSAVLLTHEHRDHTIGIGVAARRWGWPLHLTPATAAACAPLLAGDEPLRPCDGRTPIRIGGLEVGPVRTCHDAADPVAVTVRDPTSGLRVGVATDLGRATVPVRAALRGCHFLVLEANHDDVLLRDGPYPWSVKQRIGGSRGHLSNRLAAELAAELAHPALGGILLAHLSSECNEPRRARSEVEEHLGRTRWRGLLDLATQDVPSPIYDVGALVRRGGDSAQIPLGL